MITLITGVPGSGKTLFAVQIIKEQVAQGRLVYSDIDGLKIPGILPAPEDWRDTPDGSMVVYDECHRRFPATGKPGPSSDPRINAMDTHRHTAHDLVLITQWPNKLHHVVRSLVGRHVHLSRVYGLQGANVHEWERVSTKPDDKLERREADTKRWKYPKDLYALYQSSVDHEVHNKVRLPMKWFYFLGTMLVLGLLIWWRSGQGFIAEAHEEKAGEVAAPVYAEPPPQRLTKTLPASPGGKLQTLSGCAMNKDFCQCYDLQGNPLNMDYLSCSTAMLNPIPRPVAVGRSASAPSPLPNPVFSKLRGLTPSEPHSELGMEPAPAAKGSAGG